MIAVLSCCGREIPGVLDDLLKNQVMDTMREKGTRQPLHTHFKFVFSDNLGSGGRDQEPDRRACAGPGRTVP